MSASKEMRASVKELMAAVNEGFSPTQRDPHEKMENFCYGFAVDACPAELLYGTKFGQGKCMWNHDKYIRSSIPSSDVGRVELGALRVIEKALEKLDRSEQRYRKDFDHFANLRKAKREHDVLLRKREIHYSREIERLLEEAKRFGEQGQVEEALKVMENVHQTQKRLRALVNRIQQREQDDALRETSTKLAVNVCDQCGIAYGLDSTLSRLQAHLDGKLHKNVCSLRETANNLRAKYSVKARSDYYPAIASMQRRPALVSTLREDFEREDLDS
ncbi:U1 snRNP-associated protein usp106-like [Galendromus occidentalis]|uniref:U1 snRNP-associated protein usp106-like n=1 Tax=Galendromus occidentalis TaxID=34638 RepID=A0AAJ6VXG8_9ACAR|nr:U1 snRNP-associated protein usp106-like [Galendromus occidentalis]